jgi:hypothetical protein
LTQFRGISREEKYSWSVIEPLPTADPNEPVADWVKALYSGFPGAAAEKISSEIDLIAMEYGMVVRSADKPSVKIKSIPDDLNLPYKLPDAKAASELKHAPLKGFATLSRAFSWTTDGNNSRMASKPESMS